MIKNVVFDIGMVLVDFNWRGVMANLGFTQEETEKVGGVILSELWVNNKVQSMNYKIYTPREVAFFDYNSSFGKRMYALSLMFVLYKATKEVFPQYEICIQHSMNDGYYVEFENSGVDLAEDRRPL